MRDNLLVKFGGHCMPIDLNIEHLIGVLKVIKLALLLICMMLTSP